MSSKGPKVQCPRANQRHSAAPSPVEGENDAERWLNVNDVAARLGIKPRTAALWAHQGRLPAYRVGRYLRFRWEEIEQALAATCRVVAVPPATEEGA